MGPGFVAKPKPSPKRTRESVNEERARIAAVRCAKVLTLRKEGWRLKDIGREMGVSVERVRQMEAKGKLIAAFHTPEAIAARERQAAEELVEEQAELARRAARKIAWAAYLKHGVREPRPRLDPETRAIVQAHAEQQLWRQFIEPRRPPVANPPPWLQWNDAAGVTYAGSGRLMPQWRVRIT